MSNISYPIRPVETKDHDAFYDLFVSTSEEMNVHQDEIDKRVDELWDFNRDPHSIFLAAWGGRDLDKMAGYVMIKRDEKGKKKSSAHVAQLRVSVRSKFQGGGIGTELVKAAIMRVQDQGIVKRIEVLNYESSIDDRHWFEKLGFEVEGRMHKRIRDQHGDLIDAFMMAYILD